MSRWKELPDSLDPRVRQLVVQLRRLKDHSGLGLAALASRTGYSRSSWDRYLNGKALPPAEAVEALARACDTDPARLLVQREVAAEAWNAGRGGDPEPEAGPNAAPDADPDPDPYPSPTSDVRGTRTAVVPWLAIVGSSAVTALVMLVALVLWAPWESGGGGNSGSEARDKPFTGEAHPELGEFTYEPGKTYACEVKRDDDGRLYAGYSRTRTELIEQSSTRWSVVEAQCLLEHHEFSPEGVDGAFGNNTERAVRRLQDEAHIAVDGKVGPDTWKVLRK
ncbi:helix-turn-helix domain-containing protein [Streptomyces apocyni]|uniref:helix-turn-helix domain-containing protein n=1 Tax=Streptomyces apocyni TaxID=2654677 RepID=UPI0018D0BC0F|nr:helix-turn-helix domain-containing protein [Streptomyces apocyni]